MSSLGVGTASKTRFDSANLVRRVDATSFSNITAESAGSLPFMSMQRIMTKYIAIKNVLNKTDCNVTMEVGAHSLGFRQISCLGSCYPVTVREADLNSFSETVKCKLSFLQFM